MTSFDITLAELEKLKKRKDTAYIDRLDGRITPDKYDSFVKRLDEEEKDLEEELENVNKADNAFLKSSISVLELAQNASEIFKSADPEQKQRILNFVTSNLLWNGEKLVPTLAEPFDILLQTSKTQDWLPVLDEFGTKYRSEILHLYSECRRFSFGGKMHLKDVNRKNAITSTTEGSPYCFA